MMIFYFGCWNEPGHFLYAASNGGKKRAWGQDAERIEQPGGTHLDGTLAPRRNKYGEIVWQAQGKTNDERWRVKANSEELPQGQFLRHELPNGFTALQWWDRCQGDTRGACNGTILAEGVHSSESLLALLRQHFPHVVENLERAGVKLEEVSVSGAAEQGG